MIEILVAVLFTGINYSIWNGLFNEDAALSGQFVWGCSFLIGMIATGVGIEKDHIGTGLLYSLAAYLIFGLIYKGIMVVVDRD